MEIFPSLEILWSNKNIIDKQRINVFEFSHNIVVVRELLYAKADKTFTYNDFTVIWDSKIYL